MGTGSITVTGNIEVATDALLASLCSHVEIRSLIARQYRGDKENFDDVIVS